MKLKLWTVVALCLCSVAVSWAQKHLINDEWEFQRVTDAVSQAELRNQGSDWSSQYDVEHVAAGGELQVAADTLAAERARLKADGWETVSLPHTPFVEQLTVVHQWQGVCYYRKRLDVTPEEAAGQLWLEFEGAMHLADVWVNGWHVMQHAGGYTPFVVDLTGLVRAGADNELLVRLDNRNQPLIPPGKPLEALDFCYYGGIYRDVFLIAKPDVHITHPIMAERQAGGGVFVTYPEVSEERATVRVQTELANVAAERRHVVLRQTLYEWKRGGGKGRKAGSTACALDLAPAERVQPVLELQLSHPRLWYPDAPNLYVLVSEVEENGRVTDSEQTRIGIRRLSMSREKGFEINGRPLQLVGSNRHQEYPYVGNALLDAAQYRDLYQIRANGFNIVRLGHYPQDPSVLDACDELGLLAIEPIPGWQFFNEAPLFLSLTYRDVRHLIRRDRNHPSVVMWETTLNESWPPASWKDTVVAIAHAELPGDQCFTSGDSYGYDGFDVCYNDWEEGFNRPNHTQKPGFIREYYDYEFGGHYSTTRVKRGDGERALIQNAWNAQWSLNRYNTYYPWTMGGAVWSMYDYNRGCCDNICYSGVADIFRLPKFSLELYRTQVAAGEWTPAGPMPYEVFVASWRTDPVSDTVWVYGNVDEVELTFNGRKVARQGHDAGPDTGYVTSPDGGNCAHLRFAPFTFFKVPREAGTLTATGYADGKAVATCTVKTPGAPRQLAVDYFESGRPAEREDLLIVYVRLLDGDGTLCPLNGTDVTLTAEGGEVVGPVTAPTDAGIASFLVRTSQKSKLKLQATSGQQAASATLRLKKGNAAARSGRYF